MKNQILIKINVCKQYNALCIEKFNFFESLSIREILFFLIKTYSTSNSLHSTHNVYRHWLFIRIVFVECKMISSAHFIIAFLQMPYVSRMFANEFYFFFQRSTCIQQYNRSTPIKISVTDCTSPFYKYKKIRTNTSYEDAPVVLQRQEQDTRQIGPPFMRDSRLANELCERRVPPERDQ